MDLKGKVVLLTGAARIGAEVAESLARRGARIALGYRSSREAAEETIARICDNGGDGVCFRADLADPLEARRLVEQVTGHLGGLHILINMASTYRPVEWEALDAATWDEDMNANVRSAYFTALAAAPHMRRAGEGRIINFSDWISASGRPRYKHYLPYYTAKKAVQGLTEALALELAPEILVNCIAPGPILPPPEMSPDEIASVEKITPLGRWGGSDEITRAVVFLIETGFITGETIRVDGGRHLQ